MQEIIKGKYNRVTRHFETESPDYWVGPFDEVCQLAPISRDAKFGLVNSLGEIICPCLFHEILPFSDGLAPFAIDRKYGFINTKGEIVVKPIYSMAGVFKEGRAVVSFQVTEGKNGYRFGCIDNSGKLVIPLIYNFLHDFNNGLAYYLKDGQSGTIDRNGNEVKRQNEITGSDSSFEHTLSKLTQKGNFKVVEKRLPDGNALLHGPDGYFVLNSNEKVVKDLPYTHILSRDFHHEKRFLAVLGGYDPDAPERDKIRYIDPIEGYAPGWKIIGGQWGVLDASLNELIPPVHDFIEFLSDSKSFVKICKGTRDMEWIKRDTEQYFELSPLIAAEETFAKIKNAKWGIADITNKYIIPPEYDWIEEMAAGLWWVNKGGRLFFLYDTLTERFATLGGKWALIDYNGRQLIPFEVDDFDHNVIAMNGHVYRIDLTGKILGEVTGSD